MGTPHKIMNQAQKEQLTALYYEYINGKLPFAICVNVILYDEAQSLYILPEVIFSFPGLSEFYAIPEINAFLNSLQTVIIPQE